MSVANFYVVHLRWTSGRGADYRLLKAAGLLCFFLYWMGQTCLAVMPISKLRILFLVKGVIVPPTFLALFLWAVIVTHGGGPLVTGQMALTSSYMNTAYSSLTGLNVIIGLFSSMAVNMPVCLLYSKVSLLPMLTPHSSRILAASPRIDSLVTTSSSLFQSSVPLVH